MTKSDADSANPHPCTLFASTLSFAYSRFPSASSSLLLSRCPGGAICDSLKVVPYRYRYYQRIVTVSSEASTCRLRISPSTLRHYLIL